MFSTSKTSSKWWVNIWYREIIRNPCFPRKTDKWTIKTAVEFFRQISHNFAECFFANELETFIFTKFLFIRKIVCLQLSKKHALENGASVTRWKVGVDMPKKKIDCALTTTAFVSHLPFSFTLLNRITTASPINTRTRDLVKGKNYWEKRNFHFFFCRHHLSIFWHFSSLLTHVIYVNETKEASSCLPVREMFFNELFDFFLNSSWA